MSGRLDHLSALLAAMMTVIATGQMPQKPKRIARRNSKKIYVTDAPPRAELLRYCDGTYKRVNYSVVARELGVTPQHVRRVFLGIKNSARVMAAIESRLSGGAE